MAVVRNGVHEVIKRQGHRTIPSYITFKSPTERIVGHEAKNAPSKAARSTVFGVKRFIGRFYGDAEVQKDSATLPYTIFESKEKRPKVKEVK